MGEVVSFEAFRAARMMRSATESPPKPVRSHGRPSTTRPNKVAKPEAVGRVARSERMSQEASRPLRPARTSGYHVSEAEFAASESARMEAESDLVTEWHEDLQNWERSEEEGWYYSDDD